MIYTITAVEKVRNFIALFAVLVFHNIATLGCFKKAEIFYLIDN